MSTLPYETLRVRQRDGVCFMQIHRPEANNTINDRLVEECTHVLESLEETVGVVVLEGLPDVFCFGADFAATRAAERVEADANSTVRSTPPGPEALYALWTRLATGPFVVVAHVRGKANAGGVGFVAASDIVIANETAVFSLSELLFGLMPACVLPFLVRRVGFQRAHYMTLMTQPVAVSQAASWGLVDVYDTDSEGLLRKHLLRLRRLSRTGVTRYKRFAGQLAGSIEADRHRALSANREVFSDPANVAGIARYVETGVFPWERR